MAKSNQCAQDIKAEEEEIIFLEQERGYLELEAERVKKILADRWNAKQYQATLDQFTNEPKNTFKYE